MVRRNQSDRPWWRSLPGAVAKGLLIDRHAEFWLRELGATASLGAIRARVTDVVVETAEVKTFVLRPNGRWAGHHAGQFTAVEAEIDGVRFRRCYSISSVPSSGDLAITVKRHPAGRVSGWLHDTVEPGSILTLQPAAGDFVLPKPLPERMLMLSAGSGITPVMSMLRELDRRGAIRDVVFAHCARSRDAVIFASALDEVAGRNPGLRSIVFSSGDRDGVGRFSERALRSLVPDFAARETFLCGPPGLMDRVERLYAGNRAGARLHTERFGSAGVVPAAFEPDGLPSIELVRSGRTLRAGVAGTVLEQLERGGVNPPYGCRMGRCRTCRCRKHAGTVRNLVTGEVSSEPDEDVAICVSLACSDLALDL